MKLVDLQPRWASDKGDRTGMGLTFDCPVHRDIFCRQAVWFANPIDEGPPLPGTSPGNVFRWQRTGETFEGLTLTPSIHTMDLYEWDAANPNDESKWKKKTHWHGVITNGEVT